MKAPMNPNEYPLMIEVTLYRHNIKDNQLLSAILRNGDITEVNKSSFLINVNEFKNIINNNFRKDLDLFNSSTDLNLARNINSIYFLNNILNQFVNLKYVKVNCSYNQNYTRIFDNLINFEYKVLYTRIDLPNLIEDEEILSLIRDLLEEIGLYDKKKFISRQYIKINLQKLFYLIRERDIDNTFSRKYDIAIKNLLKYIPQKLENDKTEAILLLIK